MATTFLEPGGDADYLVGTTNGFWQYNAGQIATDHVHGGHIKSIKYVANTGNYVWTPAATLATAGGRISLYIYLVALPNSGAAQFIAFTDWASGGVELKLTSAGVLQLARWDTDAQIGTDGPALNAGQWYRISLAYTITSTTVNRFEVFVDGASAISVTNATIGGTSVSFVGIGLFGGNAVMDFRSSDHYIDNSTSLTDTGNIWVTAKRPVSNGTTNGFATQIGAGGSGYGSGHTLQVNERPLSTTNGWAMIGAGSAVTEEYNIEAKSVGDIDISTSTIVDWIGWASMKSLVGETVNVILDGATASQAITSTATIYTKVKGSSTYPSGAGADIGITTNTSLTTVSLYECGVIVAYIPPPPTPSTIYLKGRARNRAIFSCVSLG
jgi:hypothetical protein